MIPQVQETTIAGLAVSGMEDLINPEVYQLPAGIPYLRKWF